MRIVSLLPAATEMVCALGLRDQLVGVSHECDYPESVKRLPRVTRSLIDATLSSGELDAAVSQAVHDEHPLYALDQAALQELQPDLIVTQSLCEVCAVADRDVRAAVCALPAVPGVVNLEPRTMQGLFDALEQLGSAARVDAAVVADVVGGLSARVEAVRALTAGITHVPRVAFLEWLDPPFSCGHWNPELVRWAGGNDPFGREGEPARKLAWPDVFEWQPEVVFIACCGFDVPRTMEDVHLVDSPEWQSLPAVRAGRVYVTDGAQYFSRPGPRLVDSLEILAHALHPDVHRLPNHLSPAAQIDTYVTK